MRALSGSIRAGWLLASLALAACTPRVATPPPLPVAPAPFDHAAEIAATAALLDRGDVANARLRIAGLLARNPADPQAVMLRDGVDGTLPTAKGFAYKTKPCDTLAEIAARFLGSPLKRFLLARYNALTMPVTLAAGTTLRIPGTPPKGYGPKPRPARPKPAAPSAAAPSPSRLRAAGIAALARGDATTALTALRKAAALAPGDPLIQRDLARAERAAARGSR